MWRSTSAPIACKDRKMPPLSHSYGTGETRLSQPPPPPQKSRLWLCLISLRRDLGGRRWREGVNQEWILLCPWLWDVGLHLDVACKEPIRSDLLGSGLRLGWRPYNQIVDVCFTMATSSHLKTLYYTQNCISASGFWDLAWTALGQAELTMAFNDDKRMTSPTICQILCCGPVTQYLVLTNALWWR